MRGNVSVIMAARNAEATVGLAVSSLVDQSQPPDEIVIVDDGSTDRTSAILDDLAGHHASLEIVHLTESIGRSRARNLAFSRTRGDLIAVADADDYSLPRRLEQATQFLASNPELGGVGGQALLLDNGRLLAFGPAPTSGAEIAASLRAGRMPLIHPSVTLRREVFEQTGGYDPTFSRAQDLELFHRASKTFAFEGSSEVWIFYRRPARVPWRQLRETEFHRLRIERSSMPVPRAVSAARIRYEIEVAARSSRGWLSERRHPHQPLETPLPVELARALAVCIAS